MKYCNIVFMQGEEAEEPLKILDEQGKMAAISYLSQWDNGEYYDITNVSGAGSSDNVFDCNDYRLIYNTRIGYIGLEKIIKE